MLQFATSPQPWSPDADQKLGVKFLIENAEAILAAEPGVGKTSMTLAAFVWLKRRGLAKKLLIVAPLAPARLTWPDELEKWSDFCDLNLVVLHGKDRDESLIAQADVCVINPEGLDWLCGAVRRRSPVKNRVSVSPDFKRMKKFGFDTLALDELTKFKHHSSGRSQIVQKIAPLFGRRWGLTGSLTANGLMNIFGQFLVIDLGATFGVYITHFRRQFFELGYDQVTWTPKEGAEGNITRLASPKVLRLEAKNLPESKSVIHRITLPPNVFKIYKDLERDMFALLGDNTSVAAVNSAVASGKCRQVACGGIYKDSKLLVDAESFDPRPSKKPREWVNLHTEKVDLLESIVEDLAGSPVFVVYEFQHDLDRLLKKFPGTPVISGSGKDARQIERAWNAGKLPILLGHPASVGHGVNLQKSGRHLVFHSMPWDYELYDQVIRRLRRRGSVNEEIFVHHLIARGTVEEYVQYPTLMRKQRGEASFNQALLNYRKSQK